MVSVKIIIYIRYDDNCLIQQFQSQLRRLLMYRIRTQASLADPDQSIEYQALNNQFPTYHKIQRRPSFDANRRSTISYQQRQRESYDLNDSQTIMTGSENAMQAISQFSDLLQVSRQKVKQLQEQKNELLTQNQRNKALKQQMEVQYQYVLAELRRVTCVSKQLQTDKIKLVNDLAWHISTKNTYEGTITVHQQQIYNLEKDKARLIDELNFEKQLLADYRKENLELKGHMRNYYAYLETLVETINYKQTIQEIIQESLAKYEPLKFKIEELHDDIQKITMREKENVEYFSEMRAICKQLQNQNIRLQNNNLNQLGDKMLGLTEQQIPNKQNPEDLVKIIRRQQEIIKQYSQMPHKSYEINQNKQNSNNNDAQSFRHTTHTKIYNKDSAYVTKIIRQNHNQMQELKKTIEDQKEQIQRLGQILHIEIANSKYKSEEVDSIKLMMKKEQEQYQFTIKSRMEDLGVEKVRLERRIQELVQTNKSSRAELAEKDRIIMLYVNKSKGKSE